MFEKSVRIQIREFFGVDVEEADDLLGVMGQNVEAGQLRFVVLMDQIDDRLKDLIAFVNANSRFALFGVELEFYRDGDSVIVIPRLHGAESKGASVAAAGRRSWDAAKFFEDAESHLSLNEVGAVRSLYEFSMKEASTVSWGTGAKKGSFNPKFGVERCKNPRSADSHFPQTERSQRARTGTGPC